jgi:hypothetical protein
LQILGNLLEQLKLILRLLALLLLFTQLSMLKVD